MTYEIIPMQYDDLDRIYKPDDEEPLRTYAWSRGGWPKHMYKARWLVDKDLDTFMFRVPQGREYSKERFVYGDPKGVVVLRMDAYCQFSILYASPAMASDIEVTKIRMREALRVAGLFVNGTTDESSPFAVPNAQFTLSDDNQG